MSKESKHSFELDQTPQQSNATLVRRMLALAWKYRWGCICLLAINIVLLAMSLMGLSLVGVGVDFIRYELAASPDLRKPVTTVVDAANPATVAHTIPKPPKWPFGMHPPADWSRMEVLAAIAGGILLLAMMRAFLSYGNTIMTNLIAQSRLVVELRSQVYRKLQFLSFRFFDANTIGSLINRVTGDVQAVRQFIDGIIQVVTLVLSLAIYLTYMVRIDIGLTAACLAGTPLLFIITAQFTRKVRPAYKTNRDLFDRLILALSENIQGAHVVKGFARQDEQIEKFRKLNDEYRDQQFWIFRRVSTFNPLTGMITQFNIVIMLAYGGYLVVQHELAPDATTAIGISIGQLIVFASLLQQFSNQVAGIADLANSMQQSLVRAQRVFEVLDAPVEIKSPAKPVSLGRCRGRVAFDHVHFAYDHDTPVLTDLNFAIEPGQCAAILGHTGSGKSTLLSLVPRFYDPTWGTITIDGTDIRKFDLRDLRRNIGVVFQESFLFSNSVAANIAYGQPEATLEQIERAARIACAHDFIMQLPKGYETILHEGGMNLSGGQRQRIAIARAILLEPSVLLLDDPTASVDPETEKEIMTALESAMESRTTFLVANRISTSKRADRVIVLHAGRVVQTGTHEELMRISGHYQAAASLQVPDEESLRLLEMAKEAQ